MSTLSKKARGESSLLDEARAGLVEEAAATRKKHPVWRRRKGEEDNDLIQVSDRVPEGQAERMPTRARSEYALAITTVSRGARLKPVFMPRATLERMAKEGVEIAIAAIEADRAWRAEQKKKNRPGRRKKEISA